jgi:serine phosphatase RsbU (regulator of sigma subunit)
MMRRFIRDQRESVKLRLEIEQARQVQLVLIPDANPVVPGFAVNSEYQPAQQVGGDFFQIIPLANGGVLAVIGDVSGKGTPAAMTVSLLVGTLRTLAHYTQSPNEILASLNDRMWGRSQGGFTTCLVLRADRDGTVTVADAGHLAPYLAGKEVSVEPGLPLGLNVGSTYKESIFRLAEGEQLTLLTDGVAEARNGSGELFGFDRTAAIASQSAESIMRAAREFGQEDDITVLTLMRLAAA